MSAKMGWAGRVGACLYWVLALLFVKGHARSLVSAEDRTCPAEVYAAWLSMRSIPLQAISTRRQELALLASDRAPLLGQGRFVRDYGLVELVALLGTHGRREESECFAPGFRSTDPAQLPRDPNRRRTH